MDTQQNHENTLNKDQTTINTPLFWVIKDPRESRRQRLIELRKKYATNEKPIKEFLVETTTPLTNLIRFDKKFELPKIRDRLATFSLTNGAKINQYKWVGIYDQCLQVSFKMLCL